MLTRILDSLFLTCLWVVLWLDWYLGLFETWLIKFMINNPFYVTLIHDWWNLGLEPLYVFLEIYRIDLFLTCLLSLNLWLEYLLNTFCDSSIFMYVYNILNLCLMYMILFKCYFVWMNLWVLCVNCFSHALGFHSWFCI